MGGETGWDAHWTIECPAGQYMWGFSSHHDNSREDRRFNFKCRHFDGEERWTGTTDWTGWLNGWDSSLNRESPNDKFLIGIQSHHDNGREDRQFKFKYAQIENKNC